MEIKNILRTHAEGCLGLMVLTPSIPCVTIDHYAIYRSGRKRVRKYEVRHPERGTFYFSVRRLDDSLLLLNGDEMYIATGMPNIQPTVVGSVRTSQEAEERLHKMALEKVTTLVEADKKEGSCKFPVIDRTTRHGRKLYRTLSRN